MRTSRLLTVVDERGDQEQYAPRKHFLADNLWKMRRGRGRGGLSTADKRVLALSDNFPSPKPAPFSHEKVSLFPDPVSAVIRI
jgi:hypothetical protein